MAESLIIDPNDPERAKALIIELQELLKKHNCVLSRTSPYARHPFNQRAHPALIAQQPILIARITEYGKMEAHVIGAFTHISPRSYEIWVDLAGDFVLQPALQINPHPQVRTV